MREILNTLYIQHQGAYLNLENDTVRVQIEGQSRLQMPLIRLNGIVTFGQVSMSPFLIHRCAEDGRSVVWLTRTGRFRARLAGPMQGNVLLRRAQHAALSDSEITVAVARQMVAAKIQNSRNLLIRAARNTSDTAARGVISLAVDDMAGVLPHLREVILLDTIRGIEGEAARTYFSVFNYLLRSDDPAFLFNGRSRRPPMDRPNAVLSFLYSILTGECVAALESVGLDPQVGFLHALRPGRPALALDLMEEFRAPLVDRLVLNLLNLRQLQVHHFEEMPGGGIYLTEDGRKVVLAVWQERKEEQVEHRALRERVPMGLLPYVQARLLARHLRGDLKSYPPYLHKY